MKLAYPTYGGEMAAPLGMLAGPAFSDVHKSTRGIPWFYNEAGVLSRAHRLMIHTQREPSNVLRFRVRAGEP